MNQRFDNPRTLDDPRLVFMWNADEAGIVVIGAILGGIMGGWSFLAGGALGYYAARAYARIKENGGPGLLFRLLYWYTPSDLWLGAYVPSHVREYIGT